MNTDKSELIEFNRHDSDFQEIMHVIYYVTGGCKFNCTYCDVIDNTRRNTDYVNQLKIIDTLTDINKPFEIYLYGGEPTEYPHLDMVLDKIYEKYNRHLGAVELQTNLNVSDERIVELSSRGIEFSPSVHITFLKGDTIHDIHRKIVLIESLGSLRRIDFMLEKWKVDDHLKLYDMLIESNLKSKIQFTNSYYEFNDDLTYTNKFNPSATEYKDLIDKHHDTEEMYELTYSDNTIVKVHKDELLTTYRESTKFMGWLCSARENQVFVDFDGNWWECNVSYKRKQPLGNILTNPDMFLKMIKYQIECRNQYCEGCFSMSRSRQ